MFLQLAARLRHVPEVCRNLENCSGMCLRFPASWKMVASCAAGSPQLGKRFRHVPELRRKLENSCGRCLRFPETCGIVAARAASPRQVVKLFRHVPQVRRNLEKRCGGAPIITSKRQVLGQDRKRQIPSSKLQEAQGSRSKNQAEVNP